MFIQKWCITIPKERFWVKNVEKCCTCPDLYKGFIWTKLFRVWYCKSCQSIQFKYRFMQMVFESFCLMFFDGRIKIDDKRWVESVCEESHV